MILQVIKQLQGWLVLSPAVLHMLKSFTTVSVECWFPRDRVTPLRGIALEINTINPQVYKDTTV